MERFYHASVLQNRGKSICGLPIFLPIPLEDQLMGKPLSADMSGISFLSPSFSIKKLLFTHLLRVLMQFSSLILELYFVIRGRKCCNNMTALVSMYHNQFLNGRA